MSIFEALSSMLKNLDFFIHPISQLYKLYIEILKLLKTQLLFIYDMKIWQ